MKKADEPARVKCPKCNKELSKRYLKSHIEKVHDSKEKEAKAKEAAKDLLSYERFQTLTDDEQANMMFDAFAELDIKESTQEKTVQEKLEKQLGYKHMKCQTGIMDLFSREDRIIIEIKRWSQYKHALGQLIAYGSEYPGFQLRVHLFGKIPTDDKTFLKIINLFASKRIQVTWEPDI